MQAAEHPLLHDGRYRPLASGPADADRRRRHADRRCWAARRTRRVFDVDSPSRWRTFIEYLQAGIWHIWSGIDHLLFLLSLLLPAVLIRRNGHWEPVTAARPAFFSILKVVTAFTLAHSITLSLAALNVVRLPSRLTESVIAASIIVAALNNIFPVVTDSRARIAFAFGLLHGFGFASVLADMGLPSGARLLSLLAFNLGIETGQLAVVLAVMPIVYALRSGALYRAPCCPGDLPSSRRRAGVAGAAGAATHGVNRRRADVDSRTRCRNGRGLWLPLSDRVHGRAQYWPWAW